MTTGPGRRALVLAATALLTASVQAGPVVAGAFAVQARDVGVTSPDAPVWPAASDWPVAAVDPALVEDPPVPPVGSDTPIPSVDPGVSDPPTPTEQATTTDPPSTDPPSTDPPSTDPPSTDPPSTDPPSTDPPSTDPPVTSPPASTPPVSSAPGSEPVPVPTGASPGHPSPTRSPHPSTTHKPPTKKPTGGTQPGSKHIKKHRAARPHPHKTLRPVAPPPGAHRPHPHRKPWPITLTVRTVPALAGVRFTVDGHLLSTGPDGTAGYTAEHDFTGHRLSVLSSSVDTGSQRYRFGRWAGQRDPGQAFSHTVSGLPLRSNYVVTAAFTVQRQVSAQLVRQDGTALDPAQVSLITARSDAGTRVDLPLGKPIWLDSERPAFHHSVLSAEAVSYSLQSVIVRGTNVIDAGRQVFWPATTVTPRFTTQFHDLTITGHDALFSSSLGSSATVTFPDGSTLTRPLGPDHRLTLTNLPRGRYQVTISAGRSIVGTQQFGLSRDKTADLAVISMRDLAILGGALLLLAVALLVIGRQYWRRLVDRPGRASDESVRPREEILT